MQFLHNVIPFSVIPKVTKSKTSFLLSTNTHVLSELSSSFYALMLKQLPPLSSGSCNFLTQFLPLHLSTRIRLHRTRSSPVHQPRAFSSVTEMGSDESFKFGPYKINSKEVFYSTPLSYALVNLRPLVPDVLVCPRRELKRFVDLTAEETSDLWLTAQKIGTVLESHHKASSLTFAIQDGPQAGQTVPHVHIHIIPRKTGDFEKNDEIYDAIDLKEKELKEKLDLDKDRKDRSMDEMTEEANEYRKLFFKGSD